MKCTLGFQTRGTGEPAETVVEDVFSEMARDHNLEVLDSCSDEENMQVEFEGKKTDCIKFLAEAKRIDAWWKSFVIDDLTFLGNQHRYALYMSDGHPDGAKTHLGMICVSARMDFQSAKKSLMDKYWDDRLDGADCSPVVELVYEDTRPLPCVKAMQDHNQKLKDIVLLTESAKIMGAIAGRREDQAALRMGKRLLDMAKRMKTETT